jgi:hypothetical protein
MINRFQVLLSNSSSATTSRRRDPAAGDVDDDDEVGWCSLAVSNTVLIAPLVSALETKI